MVLATFLEELEGDIEHFAVVVRLFRVVLYRFWRRLCIFVNELGNSSELMCPPSTVLLALIPLRIRREIFFEIFYVFAMCCDVRVGLDTEVGYEVLEVGGFYHSCLQRLRDFGHAAMLV